MQNMVQIHKKNGYFVTIFFQKVLFGLSALRAPTVGPSSVSPRILQRSLLHTSSLRRHYALLAHPVEGVIQSHLEKFRLGVEGERSKLREQRLVFQSALQVSYAESP